MKTLSVAHTLLKNRFTNAPEKKVGNSERVYFPERNTMKYELQELLGLEQNNWKKNYLAWKEEQYTPEEIEQKKDNTHLCYFAGTQTLTGYLSLEMLRVLYLSTE